MVTMAMTIAVAVGAIVAQAHACDILALARAWRVMGQMVICTMPF